MTLDDAMAQIAMLREALANLLESARTLSGVTGDFGARCTEARAALTAPESSAWLEANLAEAYARGFREARDAALAIIRETPFAAGTLVGAKQADMRRRMEERVAALVPSAERAEPAPPKQPNGAQFCDWADECDAGCAKIASGERIAPCAYACELRRR
jgi:hypothetical protein